MQVHELEQAIAERDLEIQQAQEELKVKNIENVSLQKSLQLLSKIEQDGRAISNSDMVAFIAPLCPYDFQTGRISDSDVHNAINSLYDTKPYMFKGYTPKPESGLKGGPGNAVAAKYEVKQIFGKGSNAKLANEFIKEDPAGYHQLKEQARLKGLIA